jgi:hydrogenase-4 component F
MIIVQGAIGLLFIKYLLIGFGLLSIGIAIPFILMQSDIKRLLAYSSVEHMGIITVALGIATPIAVYGALLHIINHAVAKSALFYLTGIITQKYETKHIIRIRGMITAFPLLGTLFIICILAITGSPPFGIFVSKTVIVWAAFQNGQIILGLLVLLLLGAIFSGIMYYSIGMFF